MKYLAEKIQKLSNFPKNILACSHFLYTSARGVIIVALSEYFLLVFLHDWVLENLIVDC